MCGVFWDASNIVPVISPGQGRVYLYSQITSRVGYLVDSGQIAGLNGLL